MKYRNLPLISKQMGATVNADWVAASWLIIKANITIQRTTLDNYSPYSTAQIVEMQGNKVFPQIEKTLGGEAFRDPRLSRQV